MKRQIAIAFTTLLVLCSSMPLTSAAALPGPQSDNSMRWARSRVERDLDMLQRDRRDYNGHRAQAVDDLQDARNQLSLGLSYDNGHDRWQSVPNATMATPAYETWGSDANLSYVRRDIEQVIDALQRDDGDYGGHRVDAIARLQQGREQIVDALRADGGH
jgi:hypothetical protein